MRVEQWCVRFGAEGRQKQKFFQATEYCAAGLAPQNGSDEAVDSIDSSPHFWRCLRLGLVPAPLRSSPRGNRRLLSHQQQSSKYYWRTTSECDSKASSFSGSSGIVSTTVEMQRLQFNSASNHCQRRAEILRRFGTATRTTCTV